MSIHEVLERLGAAGAPVVPEPSIASEIDPEDLPREERVDLAMSLELAFDGGELEQFVPLAVGVDGSAWTSAVLVFMVHRTNGWTADASIGLRVESIALDPSDPSEIFLGDVVASATYGTSVPSPRPPYLEVVPLTPPWPGLLQVRLVFVQSTPATESQRATVSAYLIGRLGG